METQEAQATQEALPVAEGLPEAAQPAEDEAAEGEAKAARARPSYYAVVRLREVGITLIEASTRRELIKMLNAEPALEKVIFAVGGRELKLTEKKQLTLN